MGKIAFVFSGQGAQHTGMGRELCGQVPASAEVFRKADAVRPGTSEQCFQGSDELLSITENTQPCLFAMEMAAAAALTEAGVQADMAAGFSLGELSALAFAGMADFDTMFSLVCRRGQLMQKAAEENPASMAAVVKLTAEQVEEICRGFSEVYPVNFNCPGQVSVSGRAEEMKAFGEAVKAAGGRVLPLKSIEDLSTKYYIRLAVEDRVGALAPVVDVFARHQISISQISQLADADEGRCSVVFLTHKASERDVAAARTELESLDVVERVASVIRIEDVEAWSEGAEANE